MTKIKFLFIIFLILLCQQPVYAETIIVAAIKDLKTPLEEIKSLFEHKHPKDNIIFIYDNKVNIIDLLKKPKSDIDLIILDNKKSINYLSKAGYLEKSSIKILGKDKLCVVVQKNKIMRPYFLYPKTTILKSIIVGNPSLTSLGEYTKEALINLNLWDKLPDKLVLFETNQQIAENVSRGFSDGGIMYYSIAKRSHVTITDILNPSLYKPIYYVSASKNADNIAIKKFNMFLGSKISKKIFNKYNVSNA